MEERGPNRGNIPVGRGWDVMSRHLQDGCVGAKATHSSPALSLQELRLQGELGGNVSQLRAFFLRSKCLDKQRVKSSCSPGECTMPGKGFLLCSLSNI